jgi:hypothetical protein|nr:hypothetical protein Q903MT_gene2713 [Picea sitchensis]
MLPTTELLLTTTEVFTNKPLPNPTLPSLASARNRGYSTREDIDSLTYLTYDSWYHVGTYRYHILPYGLAEPL